MTLSMKKMSTKEHFANRLVMITETVM